MKEFSTAIILAGGKSRRMGFDKQQLEINKSKMVTKMIRQLQKLFEEVIVVTNTPTLYENDNCTILTDEVKGKGPLAGIHVALKQTKSRYNYVIACDMPVINEKFIQDMMETIRKESSNSNNPVACVTRFGEWIEPFNAFYSVDFIPYIEAQFERREKSVHSALPEDRTCYISEEKARSFSPNWDMFFNLNTKEDVEKYLKEFEMKVGD